MVSKKNILLVEDDLILGSTVKEFLSLSNFDVQWLKSGEDVITYLGKYKFDLIISDLMMPIIDGEELFLMIRKNRKYNSIPFIMITANGSEEIKYRQLKHGVNDYISKPFKLKELSYKITNLINYKINIVNQLGPDPFSKVTIKLSKKDFVASIDEILSANLKKNIPHEELATMVNISKSTLDKRMRKETNKNTSQYIREFKLNYAMKLMDMGEKNIQFLVNETGFNSFSYFSSSFRAYAEMTPREYIKLLEGKLK
jgi:DNA-binding response OmpR family regulator